MCTLIVTFAVPLYGIRAFFSHYYILFTVDEILINPKAFTQVTVGDVLEIYHPEEEYRYVYIGGRSRIIALGKMLFSAKQC